MLPLSTKSNIDLHSKTYSRRQFLKRAATGLTVLTPMGKLLGANNDIRIAVIGLGNKGGGHIRGMDKIAGVRIAGVCDVDPKRLEQKGRPYIDKGAFATTDARKILDRKDIDAVVIATCDHWHAL